MAPRNFQHVTNKEAKALRENAAFTGSSDGGYLVERATRRDGDGWPRVISGLRCDSSGRKSCRWCGDRIAEGTEVVAFLFWTEGGQPRDAELHFDAADCSIPLVTRS